MTTAIIGVGHLGGALARDLVAGGEQVVLASGDESHAAALAQELGESASAASVDEAIAQAEAVVVAVPFGSMKELITSKAGALDGKIVVDPSNPLGLDSKGQVGRVLPDDESAASLVVSLLPSGAHYVKAFGTLFAPLLSGESDRKPRRVALFYAADDGRAASAAERLITAAGFDPVKACGVQDAARLEIGGDLNGGLDGTLLDADQARAAAARS